MPRPVRRMCRFAAEGLTGGVSLFMAIWGYGLCATTWHQGIAEFPFLSVGLTYLPIPLGGVITMLFVIERLTIGGPLAPADAHGAALVD
jgi:TRAP-type C4-dicarboxylate transport system permease small subunit